MKNRKKVIISAIAAATAIVLSVAGWVTFSTVQLNDARTAYEAAVADLESAQSTAESDQDDLATAIDTYTADVEIAEQLIALLGEGSETLVAAADGTRTAREDMDSYTTARSPARTAGTLPENPNVEDYTSLRADVEALTSDWNKHSAALKSAADGIDADRDALAVLWQAQVDTAAESAAAAITANANASQEAKDAATAAAEALLELTNSLDPEAPELWKALLDANSTLAAQEKAYQDQKAAEAAAAAEAARRAAQNSGPRPPSGGGSTGGGGSGGGSSDLSSLEALVARDAGVSASEVSCYWISGNSARCDWPGGSRTFSI